MPPEQQQQASRKAAAASPSARAGGGMSSLGSLQPGAYEFSPQLEQYMLQNKLQQTVRVYR